MTRTKKSLIAATAIAALGLVTLAGVSHAGRSSHDCEGGGWGKHAGHHGDRGERGPGGHGQMLFEKFDSDGDGRVTRSELDKTRAEKLGSADGNADGQLTLEEFQVLWLEMARPMMVDRFQDLDEDGDGVVTEAEFGQPLAAMFVYLDRDDDGAITAEELRGKHRKYDHDDDDDEDEDHDEDDDDEDDD
jgi:Ca2+-binding EF-hand superfamily protein